MEFVNIIAAVVLLGVVVGSAFWLRRAGLADAKVLEELNDKREMVAVIPFLKQQIAELQNRESALQVALSEHRDGMKQREIEVAKLSKDGEMLRAKNEELLLFKEALSKSVSEQLSTIDALRENLSEATSKNSELKANLQAQQENNQKLKAEFEEQGKKLELKLSEQLSTIDALRENLSEATSKNSELKANLTAQQENNQKLKAEFEEQGKKLELKLNEIMQNNLDSKLKKFDETSLKSLDTILKPFKENIESFKKKIEESQESSVKKFAELSKEIEQVTKAGMSISQEAQNLTTALKGKKQTQGSWGEMILESVLEYSGLLKNVHYYTQQSYKDEQGDTKRPDVVIKLPQERTMIIDSKVSLNDYDAYIRAESEEERGVAIGNMVASFKNHIDTLDSKDYAHYKIGTLQYVFMFVPIEGAFALAVQRDPSLYEYALKKHIAIVNPSTLTVSLRTIYLYWQSEQSNTLATKLFDEAGKLYDKVVGYAESFNKIGNHIKTLASSYDTAHKQLSEGSGNILGRVENLKKLGAKATKTLKDSKIEFQDFDNESVEVSVMEDLPLLEER